MTLRAHQRHATWLALLGILLYASWPLLATAQRGNGGQYELCPHASLHKLAEETHREAPSHNPIWSDSHQLKCSFSTGMGDGSSPLPETTVVPLRAAPQAEQTMPSVDVLRTIHRFYATAPRGPPSFLF